jgi:RNA polymerase sigma factor for flagellar operon FliA
VSEGRDPRVQQLIEENVPLVQHIAYQATAHFPRHVDKKELVSAGILGLVQAAHRYDPDKGVPFPPFAAQRIRGAILDAVRSLDWAPRSVRRAGRQVESAVETLANRLGRVPAQSEVAEALGLTPDALARLQDEMARSMVLGLDATLADSDSYGDSDGLLGSTVCDTSESIDEALGERELGAYVRDAVDLLPERHRTIIQGYFFEGRSSEELAAELGVTVSRISQIRTEAFVMMRQALDAQYNETPAQPVEAQSKRMARRNGAYAAYAAAIAARRTWRSRLDAVEPRPARLPNAV